MSLSILRSSLGRLSLQKNAASTIGRVSAVAATRSFLTSSVISETKTEKKPKKTTTKTTEVTKVTKTTKVKEPKSPRILKKDLKMPNKSPLTSWQDFLVQYQAEHRKPGAVAVSLSTEAAAIWRTMSPKEKSKYGAPTEEKEKILELNRVYRKTPQYKAAAKLYRKKSPAQSIMSGYALFVKDAYDHSRSFKENAGILGEKWNSRTDEEKEVYKLRAREMNAEKAQSRI